MKRIIPDPEKYFKEFKDKFIEVDLLDIEKDIRRDQQFLVVSYIEPDPSFAALWENLCTEFFLMQAGGKILEECVKGGDWNFYHYKYKEFKEINYEELRKEFNERYGEEYDSIRMCKFFQAFPSLKQAQKYANELAKNNKMFDIYIQEVGKWVPFKPSPEMCKDSSYTDERMNKVMHAHLYHKSKAKEYMQARKQYLIEKAIKDGAKPKTIQEKFNRLDITSRLQETRIDELKMKKENEGKQYLKELIEIEMQTDMKDQLDPETVLQVTKDPAKVLDVMRARLKRYKEYEARIKQKEKELEEREAKLNSK